MQEYKPNDKVTFPADVKAVEVRIETVKEKPDKPVKLTAKIHACVKPTTGYPTAATTTPPPTVVTTPVCEMEEGMKDPQLVPSSSIKTSSRPQHKDNVRPDKSGWTSDPKDAKPSVSVKFPGNEPVPVGSVELPKRDNVKAFKVYLKREPSGNFRPYNPDEKSPSKPKVSTCGVEFVEMSIFSKLFCPCRIASYRHVSMQQW